MARITPESLSAKSVLLKAIINGEHDELLEDIDHALSLRKKMMFRPGTQVRVTTACDDRNLVGKVGTVTKVNPTRINVGMGNYDAKWNLWDKEIGFPPRMIEVVR